MTGPTKQNQKGQIILISVIFFAVMLTISAALVGYVVQATQSERNIVASNQALLLAEAGIDKAVYELNQSSAYSGESNTALGSGNFTTAVTSIDANNKKVTSTGTVTVGNVTVTRIIKTKVDINSSTVSFRFGVQVGAGGLTMGNNDTINGNLYSNGSVQGGGNDTITGDVTVAGGTQNTPDQAWTTQNSSQNMGDNSNEPDVAQSFQISNTSQLNKVTFFIKKVGTPSDITIKIVSDNSGKPSKTVLATGTLTAGSVTNTFAYIDAGLATAPSLTAATTYWVIAIAPVNATNYFVLGKDSTDGYPSGTAKYSANWNATTPVWNSAGGDLDFKIWLGGVNNSLSSVAVGGNARAHTLSNCTVGADAYYQSISSCTVGGTPHPGSTDSSPQPMPVSQALMDYWESSAAAGGVIAGPYTVSGAVSMGPKEINGDLQINGTLTMTGPIWVKGNINFNNGSAMTVTASAGASGSVIIADNPSNLAGSGQIVIGNNVNITGDGTSGSYPMLLSTNSSNNAIQTGNNGGSVILYAANGTISINNNATASEITGYGLSLGNNLTVNYVSGLQNTGFTNGPGGSWVVNPGTYVIVK